MATDAEEIVVRVRNAVVAAADIDAALSAAVRTACIACSIPYGEVWTPYALRPILYLKHVWHEPGMELAAFVAASRRIALAPGIGMAGKIWQSRQQLIIEDLRLSPDFSRQSAALAAGFRSAAGTPVIAGHEFVAVMIFMMPGGRQQLFGPIARIAEAVGRELSERPPEDRQRPADIADDRAA